MRTGNHIGLRDNGMFYTICDRDGMEVSISGDGYRPTLNSYMYGDAKAIAVIARLAGNTQQAERFETKAATLKQLIQDKLWDQQDQFFKNFSFGERKPGEAAKTYNLKGVKELAGLIPWYFNLPDPGYEGWKELMDPKGFFAPYGPTFAEQPIRDLKFPMRGLSVSGTGQVGRWPPAVFLPYRATC